MADPRRAARAPKVKAPKVKAPKVKQPGRPRRRVLSVSAALLVVVLVGVLFAFVYPTRTFLDQRTDTSRARARLAVLRRENAELADEAKRLDDPAEIERVARERYGMVRRGEQRYVVLPAPPTTTAAPPVEITGEGWPNGTP